MNRRTTRLLLTCTLALLVVGGAWLSSKHQQLATMPSISNAQPSVTHSAATTALGKLAVKAAASHAGYSREQFSNGWARVGGCDMREHILERDLTQVKVRSATDCTVLSGILNDPYTGKIMHFARGPGTSSAVQIDHVVAISDAWQTGAQELSASTRKALYNDPLELLAVNGPANDDKGDSDASKWLPPNKAYDCRYVARQIAVKLRYHLWVTPAEHDAMQRVLGTCSGQALPAVAS